MSNGPRRTKLKQSSAKDRILDNEQSIPIPSRQGHLNEQTDFAVDPALIFDELPQPFRRINKILESIFDNAWNIIEKREKQRLIDQTKFFSAQHTSSTPIDTTLPIGLIGSHCSGTLCFFHCHQNEHNYLICYDSQVDQIVNEITIDQPLKQMIVFKSDAPLKETIYYMSVVDQMGYWKMYAYKNQQYFHLFTQYETEDESKRPMCLMTQTGLHDEFLVVVWFANNDSWLEVYKLTKDQWKSEITNQEQAAATSESHTEETLVDPTTDNNPNSPIRGQFTRPALLFKARAPKFSPGSNNFQQLMKNTENQPNIGQGTGNHLYTQQVIDAKTILIRDLVAPIPKTENGERPFVVPKPDTPTPMIPLFHFIQASASTTGGTPSLAVTWPKTTQLLIYKVTKSESKGKDALDTRPLLILPFANHISSFTYDSKHDHLAVALQSGNVCIVERTTGVNDLPSIQHVSHAPIIDIHALQAPASQNSNENLGKTNGFLLLSADGHIYRAKFHSTSIENNYDIDRHVTHCFPQEQSKDASNIVRMLFLDGCTSNLCLTINEMNRIYINDALNCKQLCEIVLGQMKTNELIPYQISLVDQARSIIIGVPETFVNNSDNEDQLEQQPIKALRLYRVPLEHFPSLQSYYPTRPIPSSEELESTIETKPSKMTSSQAKKNLPVVEVDKIALKFDEKIKELFRKRQADSYERRERLRSRWNDIKIHVNPVYEQTT